MVSIIQNPPLSGGGLRASLIFLGFVIAFVIKSPLVPLHTWLPPAHVDAPGPGSAILAGVLLKMGTYGFIRITLPMMPDTFRRFAFALADPRGDRLIYGALVALAQSNLKRLIAYTSVAHMGHVMLGIAVAGGLAPGRGSAANRAERRRLGMVGHGLITGGLFLISGSIYARAGTYEMDEFGGLRPRGLTMGRPWSRFASLGLPGLAGFVADFQIFVGNFGVFPALVVLSRHRGPRGPVPADAQEGVPGAPA